MGKPYQPEGRINNKILGVNLRVNLKIKKWKYINKYQVESFEGYISRMDN